MSKITSSEWIEEVDRESLAKSADGTPSSLRMAFIWSETPEGHFFWRRQCERHASLDTVRLKEMLEEYDAHLLSRARGE